MGNIFGKIKYNKTIFELKIGEKGYSHPESLEITYDNNYYLNLEDICKEKMDNHYGIEMIITRIGENKNDFEVDVNHVKYYKWLKTSEPFGYDIRQIEDSNENILIAKLNYDSKYKKINKKGLISKKYVFSLKELSIQLNDAVKNENFKIAAKLRDEIKNFKE